jgi:hypothetical protein
MAESTYLVSVSVPKPVVIRDQFIAFEPTSIESSEVWRGWMFNYLIRRFVIDLAGMHEEPSVTAQFGGQKPSKTPLRFNQYPAVHPENYTLRNQIDGLSVPTLRRFVDGIGDQLVAVPSTESSSSERKHILDTELGGSVGIVALKFFDETATHFGCPSELDLAEPAQQPDVA